MGGDGMSGPELKPCPFCGNDAVYLRFIMQEADVYCQVCEANGPVKENDAQAIAAWNTRTDLIPDPHAIARAALEKAAEIADEIMRKYAAETYDTSPVKVFTKDTPSREQSAAKCYCAGEVANAIRAIANDPDALAEIVGRVNNATEKE